MHHSQLTDDALSIWHAGLAAVDSQRLVRQQVSSDEQTLHVAGHDYPWSSLGRIVVVGAGKAGVGMVRGLVEALQGQAMALDRLVGWVNVPQDSLEAHLAAGEPASVGGVQLHAGRPAGRNEPTAEGEAGAREILKLVSTCAPNDLVICLLSGGGSALLPLPVAGITLEDKLAVTQALSASGADIHELNTVRKQLSGIKGGRLRAACRAQRMMTLTISDVLGDPLDVIASGPTEVNATTAADSLTILKQRIVNRSQIPSRVWDLLAWQVEHSADACMESGPSEYHHVVIGNNATAVDAACQRAREMGYHVERLATVLREPFARDVAERLIDEVERVQDRAGRWCVISGGEPTVALVPRERRGLGGRNQQLVLAALQCWRESHLHDRDTAMSWSLVAGGTDGEDGPTDAAGAVLSEEVMRRADELQLSALEYLECNDAYHFLQQCGGLLLTGPTHTNVCDLRVITSPSPWEGRA